MLSIAPKPPGANDEQGAHSQASQRFNIRFPVEIWRLVIREVCDHLAEKEMKDIVEHFMHGNPSIRKLDTRPTLCVALTCRTFAKLALPLLFHLTEMLTFALSPTSTTLSTAPKIMSTLTSPVPTFLSSDARLYGYFVRFLSLGYLSPVSHFKQVLSCCPNVTHIVCTIVPGPLKWGPLLAQLHCLVALRINAYDSLCADDDSSALTFPTLEILFLLIQQDRAWGTISWNLPKLRRLSLLCVRSPDLTRSVDFLQRYGKTLDYFYLEAGLGPLVLAELESLCPRLTHLQVIHPLLFEPNNPKPVHRGITIIEFLDLRREELEVSGGNAPIRRVLENLHLILFPCLKQIRCPWSLRTPPPDSPEFSENIAQPERLPTWFLELVAEWERNGIELIRTDIDDLITLDSLN